MISFDSPGMKRYVDRILAGDPRLIDRIRRQQKAAASSTFCFGKPPSCKTPRQSRRGGGGELNRSKQSRYQEAYQKVLEGMRAAYRQPETVWERLRGTNALASKIDIARSLHGVFGVLGFDREHEIMVGFDRHKKCAGWHHSGLGDAASVRYSIEEQLRAADLMSARWVLFAHNHTALFDAGPSTTDVISRDRKRERTKAAGIGYLGDLIVTQTHFSFNNVAASTRVGPLINQPLYPPVVSEPETAPSAKEAGERLRWYIENVAW